MNLAVACNEELKCKIKLVSKSTLCSLNLYLFFERNKRHHIIINKLNYFHIYFRELVLEVGQRTNDFDNGFIAGFTRVCSSCILNRYFHKLYCFHPSMHFL